MEESRVLLNFIVSKLGVERETYLGLCIRKAMGSVLDMFILRSNLSYSPGAW